MNKDLLRNGDVISGAVLAALGIYILIEAHSYSFRSEDGPGPGFFPVWYGVLMVVLSLALIVSAARKTSQQSGEVDWRGIGKAAATWLAFAASAALMVWTGFLVSFALLAFVMIAFIFQQPPLKAGLIAVCASAGFYVVFPLALGVQLPVGVFGF